MRTTGRLDILILTWNRRSLLREALESALAQTVQPARIVVVDNASDDGTDEYVCSVAADNSNVVLVRQKVHVDVCANILLALDNVQSEYFVLMHDDDLLDPNFVAGILSVLDKERDVSLVCSFQKSFKSGEVCGDADVSRLEYELYTSKAAFIAADFARSLIHQSDSVCFPSVVYKTGDVKTDILRNNVYGKIMDKPFLFDCIGEGKIVRLLMPLYKYRVHGGQDTGTSSNGPYPDEILNMLSAEKKAIEEDGCFLKAFMALSIRTMKSLYKWGGNPSSGWKAFVAEARKRGLTGGAVSKPWRIPFWRNYSNVLCRRLLSNARRTAEIHDVSLYSGEY